MMKNSIAFIIQVIPYLNLDLSCQLQDILASLIQVHQLWIQQVQLMCILKVFSFHNMRALDQNMA